MSTPLQILKKYWGHEQFRPLQADIIDAVVAQRRVGITPNRGWQIYLFSGTSTHARWHVSSD